MLREGNVQTLNWADKTMSVMRERQLEACEDRLNSCPDFGLFDGCDDARVETLWQGSYDAQEHPVSTALHTTRQLQEAILAQLPAEAALLSVQEHLLVERLIVLDGEAELLDWEESSAAESLVRRMWCTLTRTEDGRAVLRLPKPVLEPLMDAMTTKEHIELREKLFRFDATIRGLLYIGGFLHYATPLEHLLKDVVQGTCAEQLDLCMRYLRTAYDYMLDAHGEMILLHPGLAEPERLMRRMARRGGDISFQMDEATLVGAIGGLLPEEIPPYEQMVGLLRGAVRPEITEDEAVEDLRMLAKQGVSLEEMNEVLSTLLMVLPTPAMLDGVRQINRLTPHWCGMGMAVTQ